ncbi:MAG TPA: ATP-binding protein [Bdellovibrionota bacterium]|jgi:PAS domain S-box-containing protein
MDVKTDQYAASLRQSLFLYRRLLSLMNTPRSEDEVIRLVVDSIYEQFPAFRCSFSHFETDGKVYVAYVRQPDSMPELNGKVIDLSFFPTFLGKLYDSKRAVVVNDISKEGILAPLRIPLFAFSGNVARIDIPFEEADGKIGMLSLSHPEPQEWDENTVALLTEVAELVGLMLREARVQEKLRSSEALFRQFAESVQVVFWMTEVSKEMLYVSPAYEQIWGRSIRSLFENPFSFIDAIHPEDRERVRQAVQRQAEEPYQQEYRVVRPDGSVRWVKDRGFQVRDETGKVRRMVGIAEDITALREAEDTLEATRAQVVMTTKFAALGEMASGMAHEINNPLAVIHGLAVQLQEVFRSKQVPTKMVTESLESIEKMSNRIAGIVKGLRTFSRQTAGDPMTPTDFGSILQETMAMCEARLRASDVEVTVSLPDSPPWISCRSSEISQVILNLVSNAFDAVHGTPIKAIAVNLETKGRFARLTVEDSGTGIRADLRDRIFQPFFTTKDVGRGTGLGLSISKGIVEAHGGTLSLDTRTKSTCFVVELPSVSK